MPCRHAQGDACALPKGLPAFDAVLAANLICRLPNPRLFLDRLPSLVGFVCVCIVTGGWIAGGWGAAGWGGGVRVVRLDGF